MTFNEVHKPPFDINLDYITFARQLKNAVCVAYIDTDGEYVEHWHKNKEEFELWLSKMGKSTDPYVYFNGMGVSFRDVMVLSRPSLPDFFDYNLHPHEMRPVIEAFVLENLTPQGYSH